MSYANGNPNGKLYVGNVKWSNDYKNVMLFDTRIKRNEFLESHLTLLKENVIFINPNRYVDIDGKIDDVESWNYIYYTNSSDISGTHYCCFITDYEYIAPKTTRLYIELDIFQMYHYSADYYQSFIERAIVKKSNDGNNFLPEPVSAPLIYESVVNDILTQADWQPIWVLHSASYYNSTTGEYDYSGKGTNNTYGEYGRFINSKQELQDILKMYGRQTLDGAIEQVQKSLTDSGSSISQTLLSIMAQWLGGGIAAGSTYQDNKSAFDTITDTLSFAQFQDHRDELIGLYAIPKWLYDGYHTAGGDTNYADNQRIDYKAQGATNAGVTININTSSLANGYTPRNKKMLTSVCRAYVLANKTGLQIPFKPELFSSSSPTLHLYGITMATGGYQFYISDYADYQTAYGEVAYNSERRVGYDANTGINKALSIISAGAGAASGASAIMSGTPGGIVAGAGTIGQNLVSAIDSLGTKEQHFGNNGDLLRITGARPQLHWYELNPSVSECQAIDNFFDMYGYTIQKHQNPLDYLYNKYTSGEHEGEYNKASPTRPQWNYIKTDNINLRGNCPADYENKLKSIFNSGVTIWHKYSDFGDYSKRNWTT